MKQLTKDVQKLHTHHKQHVRPINKAHKLPSARAKFLLPSIMANLSDFSRFGHLIGDDEKRVLLDGRAELEGENFFTGFYQKL